jgi:hypothetical protein
VQAAFLHRHVLKAVNRGWLAEPQDRPALSFAQVVLGLPGAGKPRLASKLRKLADLLFECHLAEQGVDSLLYLRAGQGASARLARRCLLSLDGPPDDQEENQEASYSAADFTE